MTHNHPPSFNFAMYKYWATVQNPFQCPCYSEPYGRGGFRLDHEFRAGDAVEIFESHEHLDETGTNIEYVSARTSQGWINVWTLYNREGNPRGINFCTISWELQQGRQKRAIFGEGNPRKRRRSL